MGRVLHLIRVLSVQDLQFEMNIRSSGAAFRMLLNNKLSILISIRRFYGVCFRPGPSSTSRWRLSVDRNIRVKVV